MMSQAHPPFAAGTLDRDAATRNTPELLQAAWSDPHAQLLQMPFELNGGWGSLWECGNCGGDESHDLH